MFKKINSIFSQKSKLHSQLNSYNIDNSYFFGKGKAVWMERDYKSFASEAYMKNVVAHRSINMIAQGAASVPLKLYSGNNKSRREVTKHPILNLLKKPNPLMNGKSLMQTMYIYALIHGNAYLMAVTGHNHQPTELIALRPDRVSPLAGDNFMPTAYRYTVGQRSTDYTVDPLNGHCNILHLRNFHPLSDWFGLSPIEAAAYSIDQHNQAGAWNQALLQNGARPSGAIIVKHSSDNHNLNNEQYNRLKQSIDETMSGALNAGRPLILEGGLEWQEMSLTPKDMDFIESKHSAARDIALSFGMPPQLLGIPGDNTYSNLVEARSALWEQTIIPMMDNAVERLSNWLCNFYADDLEITYDLESVPALSTQRESVWARIDRASFMTNNEKRAAVGLSPLSE